MPLSMNLEKRIFMSSENNEYIVLYKNIFLPHKFYADFGYMIRSFSKWKVF